MKIHQKRKLCFAVVPVLPQFKNPTTLLQVSSIVNCSPNLEEKCVKLLLDIFHDHYVDFTQNCNIKPHFPSNPLSYKNFSNWLSVPKSALLPQQICHNSLNKTFLPISKFGVNVSRSVTKFSLKHGKKNSVRAVLNRFYRLETGVWIRRIGGCHKKLHKKSPELRWRLQQHVVCNETQCIMLDKMVTHHWKKKRYYIDDPFEPYQVRNNFKYVLPKRKR